MLDFTGLGSVLRTVGFLYWVLAVGAILLALFKGGRTWRGKVLWTTVAVAVFGFLPGKLLIEKIRHDAYARQAWAYFKKKCETEAGEKIYKTFTGVKSVLVIKPLPPATEKDLYNQFWYGDPYSDATPWSRRAEAAASKLAWSDGPVSKAERGRGFEFVELPVSSVGDASKRFAKYTYPQGARDHTIEEIEKSTSRFGVSWEDMSTPEDRKYWVAASRLRIVDLTDGSLVAERIGFLIEAGFGSTSGGRRPWLAARGQGDNGRSCPDAHAYSDRWFLLRALRSFAGEQYGK